MEQIHVTQWGEAGPVVVLVHGSAQGSRVGGDKHFAAQRALAARGWRLRVPDRPGHGRSPSPGRPDDAEADGAWVADLLGDGAHLVGHSFGGCVALAAAARRPDAVLSLTLIEPGMHRLAAHDTVVRRFLVRLLFILLFSISPVTRARRFAKLVGIPPEIGDSKDRAELAAMGRGIARLRVPSAQTLRRELNIVKQAHIPLLVVTGGWNPAFETVGKTVATAGGGQHRTVASPHHFPNLVGAHFNELLEQFMKAAVTPGRQSSDVAMSALN